MRVILSSTGMFLFVPFTPWYFAGLSQAISRSDGNMVFVHETIFAGRIESVRHRVLSVLAF